MPTQAPSVPLNLIAYSTLHGAERRTWQPLFVVRCKALLNNFHWRICNPRKINGILSQHVYGAAYLRCSPHHRDTRLRKIPCLSAHAISHTNLRQLQYQRTLYFLQRLMHVCCTGWNAPRNRPGLPQPLFPGIPSVESPVSTPYCILHLLVDVKAATIA